MQQGPLLPSAAPGGVAIDQQGQSRLLCCSYCCMLRLTLCFPCCGACRLEELLEVKEALQKQLEEAQLNMEQSAAQLAETRKQGEELAGKLAAAEEAKGLAEQVRGGCCVAFSVNGWQLVWWEGMHASRCS